MNASTLNPQELTEEQLKAELARLTDETRRALEQMKRDREEGQKAMAAIRAIGERTDATLRETQNILAQIRAARSR